MNCQGDQNWVVILSALLPSSAFTLLVSTLLLAEDFPRSSYPKVTRDRLGWFWKHKALEEVLGPSTHHSAVLVEGSLCFLKTSKHTHKDSTDQTRTPWLHFPFFPLGSSCCYHILESLKLFKLCSLMLLFLFSVIFFVFYHLWNSITLSFPFLCLLLFSRDHFAVHFILPAALFFHHKHMQNFITENSWHLFFSQNLCQQMNHDDWPYHVWL